MPAQQEAVSVDEYKTAMRHVVSPVAVVTWRHQGRPEGLTITAICSATTEPPTLVVCIRGDKPAAEQIRQAGRFDLDHVGAEISQQLSTKGAGDQLAKLDDAQAIQGAFGVCHFPSMHIT